MKDRKEKKIKQKSELWLDFHPQKKWYRGVVFYVKLDIVLKEEFITKI
jgi:hypothetical protein